MAESPDWLQILKGHSAAGSDEINLEDLRPGDRLRVVTNHTCYDLLLENGRSAILSTNRPDRPEGRIQIMGCTFGCSSTIKPNQIFCGGNLEFTFENGHLTHLTTTVRELYWIRCESSQQIPE